MPEEKKEHPLTNSSKRFKIICTTNFLQEAKQLARKYPNIKKDFFELRDVLKTDPITGNNSLGNNVFKVRMQISDKNKGQSGGARVIIQVKIIDHVIYVLSVYDKSKFSTILDETIKKLLRNKDR